MTRQKFDDRFGGIADLRFAPSKHAEVVIEERSIKLKWIQITLSDPEFVHLDHKDDALTHALRRIPEYGDRVLRGHI